MRPARLTIDRLSDEGCLNIVCAMLKQMSNEFRLAYRNYLSDPGDLECALQFRKIRKEFKSRYFFDLTNLDGKNIVARLEAIVVDELAESA